MRSGDEVDDISSEGNLTGIQAVARFDEGLSLSVATSTTQVDWSRDDFNGIYQTSAVNRKHDGSFTDTGSCAKLRPMLGVITRLIKCCCHLFFMEAGRVEPGSPGDWVNGPERRVLVLIPAALVKGSTVLRLILWCLPGLTAATDRHETPASPVGTSLSPACPPVGTDEQPPLHRPALHAYHTNTLTLSPPSFPCVWKLVATIRASHSVSQQL